jgi:hypothetical protein
MNTSEKAQRYGVVTDVPCGMGHAEQDKAMAPGQTEGASGDLERKLLQKLIAIKRAIGEGRNGKGRQRIPLDIYQTWNTLDLPPRMKANVAELRRANPEFAYHLFDDAMCEAFIAEHFEADVLAAFRKLKPGAFKADLWRYCIMYQKGGIYLDIKFRCVPPFTLLQLVESEHYVRDRQVCGISGIYQGLMVQAAGNPTLWRAIRCIVEHCESNFYGDSVLSVTGPTFFARKFADAKPPLTRPWWMDGCVDPDHRWLYFAPKKNFEATDNDLSEGKNKEIACIRMHTPSESSLPWPSTRSWDKKFLSSLGTVVMEAYSEYREEQAQRQPGQYYSDLWSNVDIYNYPRLRPTTTRATSTQDPQPFKRGIREKFSLPNATVALPAFFQNAHISTPAASKGDDELWFVLHKVQSNKKHENYQHFFAVFDPIDKRLLRYSELFKLGSPAEFNARQNSEPFPIELVIGCRVEPECVTLAYSLNSADTVISRYTHQTIRESLQWTEPTYTPDV